MIKTVLCKSHGMISFYSCLSSPSFTIPFFFVSEGHLRRGTATHSRVVVRHPSNVPYFVLYGVLRANPREKKKYAVRNWHTHTHLPC